MMLSNQNIPSRACTYRPDDMSLKIPLKLLDYIIIVDFDSDEHWNMLDHAMCHVRVCQEKIETLGGI